MLTIALCQNKLDTFFQSLVLVLMLAIILISPKRLNAQITDPKIEIEGGNLIVRYSYAGIPGLFHIYIDTDQDNKTGFRIPKYESLFAANFLVEGDRLSETSVATYTYEWEWAPIGAVVRSRPAGTNNTFEWKIPLQQINLCHTKEESQSISLVYETTDSGGDTLDISDIVEYRVTCEILSIPTMPTLDIDQSIPAFRIAIPGYFYPDSLGCVIDCYWTQIGDATPVVGISIANPANGPGDIVDRSYVDAIQQLQNKGVKVLGYVSTEYSKRDIKEVESDIDRYYEWYNIDGIFLDEASNTCSKLSYYQNSYDYIKSKKPNTQVVINPGTNTEECYVKVADVIVTFEDSFERYFVWEPSSWVANYPAGKFWNIIHSTTQSDLSTAVGLAVTRNTGWIYITPDIMGADNNPYDTLPTGDYWAKLIQEVQNTK